MGALDVVPKGVLSGEQTRKLFEHARANKYAIPAVNVTSSSTVNAALEAARDINSPIILQVSQGGAAYFAGKGIKNTSAQEGSIAGAIAAAAFIRAVAPAYGIPVVLHSDHCAKKLLPWYDGMLDADEAYFKEHGVPLFSSHMLDLSEESDDENIETCAKYFTRMAKMNQFLEMEIGITGGEEDGVASEQTGDALYTKPETVFAVYKALAPISPNFSIAAAFGNVHGVYKPGNVKLKPEILGDHQKYAAEQLKNGDEKPLFLVFHGGSGSSAEEIQTAVGNGVVKMNVDTDMQWAYLTGIRDFIQTKSGYLQTQVGNPDGPDKPNKKYYDPRVWVRSGEVSMSKRVEQACRELNNVNTL